MQLTPISDPLPVPRGSAAAAAPVTAVTPTAALPVEAPAVLPDLGSSTNADTASQTAARDRRGSGGTPVDAPATIIDFSAVTTEGVESEVDPMAELLTRFRDAIAPEKVFGTDASDVPGAKPANLARELARASVIAAQAAEAVLAPTGADAADAGKAFRAA